MKLSTLAVLATISSTSAFSVSYLNQLSTGAATAPSGGGMTSYLDGISGADKGVPALVTALEQSYTPPAPAAPAAAAPATDAAPTSKDYLSALSGSSVSAVTGAGLVNYLDALPRTASVGGAGLTGYLDALPQMPSVSGAGLTSHVDTLGGSSAPAAYTPPAPAAPAQAAPVAAAPVAAAPAAPLAASAAPSAGDYLSTLGGGSAPTGAGPASYLSTLPQSSAPTGSGLTGYLNTLAVNASASGAGLSGYADALATNTAINTGSGVTAFLESVYSQIMALPDDGSKKVSGSSVAFATTDGQYAISFVKK